MTGNTTIQTEETEQTFLTLIIGFSFLKKVLGPLLVIGHPDNH
jgi:hypothetical protein